MRTSNTPTVGFDLKYANLDGLELAIHGTIADETLVALEAAKAVAAETRGDAPAILGGLTVMVKETGARGGYAYVFSTGEDGETWFLHGKSKPEGAWALRVSINAGAFVQMGYDPSLENLRKHIDARLVNIGFSVVRDPKSGLFESMGRVDFAFDFRADDFVLDPMAVVSKGSKTGYLEGATAHWAGRRVTGCTIGKMPNRQVVIYDKVADSIAKGKTYWWKVWGLDPEEGARVWRVELRAGKRHLREVWQVKGWDDLAQALASWVADTLDKVRLVDLIDSNVTRCPDAGLWRALRDAVSNVMDLSRIYAAPGLIRETTKARFDAMMRQLLKGVALTHAVVMQGRLDLPRLLRHVGDVAADVIAELQSDVIETLTRAGVARGRYSLLEDTEWMMRQRARRPAFGNALAT